MRTEAQNQSTVKQAMFEPQRHQLTLAFDPQPDVAPVTITKPPAMADIDVSRIVNEFKAGVRQGELCERYDINGYHLAHLLLTAMAATDEQADAAIERLGVEGDTASHWSDHE